MTTQTTGSDDSTSTIQTVDELRSQDSEIEEPSIITSASTAEPSRQCYSSDLWEPATDVSTPSSRKRTESNYSSVTLSDGDELRRERGGARREAGEGTSHTDETGESYYPGDWESNHSSDSCPEESFLFKAIMTQQRFIQNKLRLLKKSEHKLAGPTTRQAPEAAFPEVAEEKSSFCQKAIQMMRNRNRQGGISTKAQTGGIGKKSSSSEDHSGILINREIINELKMENFLSTMKKAASVDITTGTDSCQHCQESRNAVLRRDFIRHRTSRLGNDLTERRLDWLLSTQDSLTAVGDLARKLPKPTDDPQEIWDKMMDHGIT